MRGVVLLWGHLLRPGPPAACVSSRWRCCRAGLLRTSVLRCRCSVHPTEPMRGDVPRWITPHTRMAPPVHIPISIGRFRVTTCTYPSSARACSLTTDDGGRRSEGTAWP